MYIYIACDLNIFNLYRRTLERNMIKENIREILIYEKKIIFMSLKIFRKNI